MNRKHITSKTSFKRPRTVILNGVCLAFFLICSVTYAQTSWNLNNVVLSDGATATGSFDYNPSGGVNQYTNVNITVTNSTLYGTANFVAAAPFSTNPASVQFFTNTLPNQTGAQTFRLNFNPSLFAGNSTVNLTGFTGFCTGNCGIVNPITFITGGTVQINTPPTAVCTDISVNLDSAGNATITPDMVDGGSTDDNVGFTLSLDKSNFTCADVGANTVTLTVTDTGGATDSCTANVTVVDNTPPILVISPPAITVNNEPGLCGANITVPPPVSVSDNCSYTLTNDFNGTTDASGYYEGTTIVRWRATDPSGNTTTRVVFITVTDTEPAVINCPADITVNNDPGMCSAMVTIPPIDATDNCSMFISNSFTGDTNDASGVYPVGTTVVTWQVTADGGVETFCTQNITVNDTEASSINCPADMNLACPQIVTYSPPTISDNCNVPTVPQVVSGFSPFGSFGTSTYFISDATMTGPQAFAMAATNGYDLLTINSPEENGYIKSVDPSLSVILGYNDITTEGTFEWQSGQPAFFEDWAPGNPNSAFGEEDYVVLTGGGWIDVDASISWRVIIEFTDYSSGEALQVTGIPSGTFVTDGNTTNTFFYKDASGATATCSFSISISDSDTPTITCADDISANSCAATILFVPTPTLGDGCGTTLIPTTPKTPYNFNMNGELINTPATLSNATMSNADVVLRINFSGDHDGSTESFALAGPDNVALFNQSSVAAECAIVERFVTIPMATWNSWISVYGAEMTFTLLSDADVNQFPCPENSNYFQVQAISLGDLLLTNDYTNTSDASSSYPLGTTVVTWTVTDVAGNSNTCTQNITVSDTEPPTINCPADIVRNSDPFECFNFIVVPGATGSDNCSDVTITNDITGTSNASGVYSVGTTVVTWTATDAVGNTTICTQNITVNDVVNPNIICPANITTDTDPATCGAMITVPVPAAFDNCGVVSITNDFTGTGDASGIYPTGTTVVTWTAADAAGNTAACIQSITVNDTVAPSISCPADITADIDPATCGAMITVPAPAAFDNCGVVSITNDFTGTGDASGIYPTGTTVVTWTAADAAGNTAICMQSITVNDTVAPSISCPADITVNNNAGECSTLVNIPAPTVTDNCPVTLTNDFNNSSNATGLYPTGTTLVTWTATDPSGNTDSCTQLVTIKESVAPTISPCPADINLSCPQVVNYTMPTTTDNCGFPTVPASIPGFSSLGSFGNSTYFAFSSSFMTGPQAFAMAAANNYDLLTINSIEENNYILSALGGNDVFLGYNDITTEGTFEWQSGQPTPFENWATGQPDSSSETNDYVAVTSLGEWSTFDDTDEGIMVIEFHDYSNGQPIQITGIPSGSFVTNTTVNTFFSKDISGNIATCSFTITINDTTAPSITCSADITANAAGNACIATVNVPTPISIGDDCGATLIPTTSRVPYEFREERLFETSATLTNMTASNEDVALRITFSGGHNSIDRNFLLRGPDNVTLLNEGNILPVCAVTKRLVTIPMATWNSWIMTYGTNLTFTVDRNNDVPQNACLENSNYLEIEALSFGNLALTNDYTNTADASGDYPVGITMVTWTVTDLAGNSTTCVQTITVNETVAPNISCPADISVDTDSGLCSAVVNYATPLATDNCTDFTNTLQNVLDNFNENSQSVTSLIPNAFNFVMDGENGVNANLIEDGGENMYDFGNAINTNLSGMSINYSDNAVVPSTTFGANGAFFTRKVDNMWLLAADLDNVTVFNIFGSLGADGLGLTDDYVATLTVEGTNYNIFVKRVRENTTVNNNSSPSVNHLIIIPENTNASHIFSLDTNSDFHQVIGLSGTTRLYYLLFASENSGLVDNTTIEAMATSFVTNMFPIRNAPVQTAGLPSGSAFPVGTTTNTFVATDASGNQSTCSFTVTVNDPSGNCNVLVSPKVYLQGSVLNSTIAVDGLMRDDLRVNNYIPLNTPYTDNTSIDSAVLSVAGSDAIVDWVWVELRDAMTNTQIVEGKSALLQRDGDVVALDGTSPVMFNQLSGNYHVVIKHRNHLGIMSKNAIALSNTTTVVDFTSDSIEPFGTNAQTSIGNGLFAMWAGDTNGDAVIQYVGGIQDTPGVLAEVLNDGGNFLNLPTFVSTGYSNRDVNMDGNVQYAGGNSELPFILQNILGDSRNFLNLSTWPINAQLPTTMGRAIQLRTTFESSKH
ncbi:MAG: HYR domain-containing protein [Bacteroidota bacterium]